MCERCGNELRDCAEEEANRDLPYVEAGYAKTDTECTECGNPYVFTKETRDDRGVATSITCPRCHANGTEWYDTMDLGRDE